MFFIGLDLGQRVDFTAFAIVERHDYYKDHLDVRWLERMPLGTPYTAVVRRAEEIAEKLYGRCEMAVDATGLGAPVVDLLRNGPMRCGLSPVVITGAGKAHSSRHSPDRDMSGSSHCLLPDFQRGSLRRAVFAVVRVAAKVRSWDSWGI